MSRNASKSLRSFLTDTLERVPPSGIREFFDVVSEMPEIISLGVGEPDFVTPWHVREAALFALEKGATNYTSNAGLSPLRKAIGELRGYHHDDVLITVGVSEALDLAIRAITNPGDEIIYHEPCYVSYRPLIEFAHGKPVAIKTYAKDNFCLCPDTVRKAISKHTKAIILNYPNNPTGAILPCKEVEVIAKIAIEKNILVITDEIYSELTYDGSHTSIVSIPGMKERTILLHGFSKALAMTGFRIGYACAPPEILAAMLKIHQYTMLCAPILSQKAAMEAMREREKDIGEMRTSYRQRRNYFVTAMDEIGWPLSRPSGAFYAFPNISRFGLSSREFALKLLKEMQVAVVPGTAFGKCGEGYVRCSYATSLEKLKEAISRIDVFCKGLV